MIRTTYQDDKKIDLLKEFYFIINEVEGIIEICQTIEEIEDRLNYHLRYSNFKKVKVNKYIFDKEIGFEQIEVERIFKETQWQVKK